MARVQLSKIEEIIGHQKFLKASFVNELDESTTYVHQHIDDVFGDIGLSASIILQNKELAIGYGHALKAKVDRQQQYIMTEFLTGILYSHWDGILERVSPRPNGYPWDDPAYMGEVEYSKDICPQTLDILGRTLRFEFNMNIEHARLIAIAVNKVDVVLGK